MRTCLPALCLVLSLSVVACDTTTPAPLLPPPTDFEVTFGTDYYDGGIAILETVAGQILVAGSGNGVIAPADGTLPTPSLTLLDASGQIRWTRIYDSLKYGSAVAVLEPSPERYVVLTVHHDESFRNHRVALQTVDAEGNLLRPLFERDGTMTSYVGTRPLIGTSDGDMVLVVNDEFGSGPNYGHVLRLDPQGNERWRYQTEEYVSLHAVVGTDDGGFLVLGEVVTPLPYRQQTYLLRLDANGTMRWTRVMEPELARDLVPTTDAGFLIVGSRSEEPAEGGYQRVAYIQKINEDGMPMWGRSFSVIDDQPTVQPQSITATTTDTYVLTGWVSRRSGGTDAFVLAISAEGDEQWTRLFGAGGMIHQGRDIIQLTDGRLTVTGAQGPDIPSFGGSDFDTFVLTLAPSSAANTP